MGFDALTDEKDPVVRGYTENLRRQVADIAARYGVNARDVFRADVQERMEVDDLATVAALVKRLGTFSEKKPDAKAFVELARDVSRGERKAEEALDEAVEILRPGIRWTLRTVVEALLRSNMVELAKKAAGRTFESDYSIWAEIQVAEARETAVTDVPAARKILEVVMDHFYGEAGWEPMFSVERARSISRVYELQLRLMSRQELMEQETWYATSETLDDTDYVSICVELIRGEEKRRRMATSGAKEDAMRNASRNYLHKTLDATERLRIQMMLAEILQETGRPVDSMLEDCRASLNAMDPLTDRKDLYRSLARIAGKLGKLPFVDGLNQSAEWKSENTQVSLRQDAVLGCLDAGNVEVALEIIRQNNNWDLNPFILVRKLLSTLLNAGDRSRAELLAGELGYVPLQEMRAMSAYRACRARQGEDVLGEDDEEVFRGKDKFDRAENRAMVAIGTMEFARAMKKRIGL